MGIKSVVILNEGGARTRAGYSKFVDQQLKLKAKNNAGKTRVVRTAFRCKVDAESCEFFHPGDETGNYCLAKVRCIYKVKDEQGQG